MAVLAAARFDLRHRLRFVWNTSGGSHWRKWNSAGGHHLEGLATELSGLERIRQAPTLLWLSASDTAIEVVCYAGVALSVLLLVGIAPMLVLPLLWLLYLSLVHADALFLGYQWDALLLEVGFAAIFLAPRGLWPGRREYRFTTREELAETGYYWERHYVDEFCPVLTLRDGRLTAVRLDR